MKEIKNLTDLIQFLDKLGNQRIALVKPAYELPWQVDKDMMKLRHTEVDYDGMTHLRFPNWNLLFDTTTPLQANFEPDKNLINSLLEEEGKDFGANSKKLLIITDKSEKLKEILTKEIESNDFSRYKLKFEDEQNEGLTEHLKERLLKHIKKEKQFIEGILERVMVIKSIYPATMNEKVVTKNIERVKSKLSIKELALLFKLLSEEALEVNNKSALSRSVTTMFYTDKSPDPSAKSFKNHYDTPEDATKKSLDTILVNMRHRLQKL